MTEQRTANQMSVAEAMRLARQYDERHADTPSVSRTLADEIERLERAVKEMAAYIAEHREGGKWRAADEKTERDV